MIFITHSYNINIEVPPKEEIFPREVDTSKNIKSKESMSYQDKTLICKDCTKEFIWTAGEQQFFAQKGFDKPPIRCLECRKKKKAQQKPQPVPAAKEMHTITCTSCGKQTEIDFRPRNLEGILCADCFKKKTEIKK